MREIKLNQFQDYYDINNDFGIIIDFLNGKMSKLEKDNEEIVINNIYSDVIEKLNLGLQSKLFANTYEDKMIFVLIPSYKCNMRCEYCYEGLYKDISNYKHNELSINLIIELIDKLVSQKKPKNIEFVLLGGEPILDENIKFFKDFFEEFNKFGYEYTTRCITNGLNAYKFIQDIKKIKVTSFQITLDGCELIQNKRRVPLDKTINGFQEINKSIECLLKNNIGVDVRVNVDEYNLVHLRELSDFILSKGWNQLENFSVYLYPISMNGYDVNRKYLSEAELLNKILEQFKLMPRENRIFELDFHGLRFVRQLLEGKLPCITRQFCASSREQYVFDLYGNLYTCWWGSSNEDFKVGEIADNKYTIDTASLENIHNRSIKTISKCVQCKYKYVCGSGCAYKAYVNNGSVKSGNCADFNKIMEYYLKYYFDTHSNI